MRGRFTGLIAVLVILLPGVAEAEPGYRFDSLRGSAPAALGADPLFYPSGVAVATDGSVWIADTANHVIRRMTSTGGVEIVAGNTGLDGLDNGHALGATFRYPQGLVFDPAGNLYIADSGNGVIRRLRTDGIVETWAGTPERRGTRNGNRLEATFVTPIGLAWDVTGELWISDYSAHTIRRIDREGKVETLSGIDGTPGFVDGDGERAKFYYPAGIDIDAQGRLWVADVGNGAIRIVNRDGFTETMAGRTRTQGHRDGSLDEAQFDHPSDLAIAEDGSVFITDSWSHTIRMISDGEVTTIAGSAGAPGFSDGRGSYARFNHPVALALGPGGLLFVADMANHELRQGTEESFGTGRRRTVRR